MAVSGVPDTNIIVRGLIRKEGKPGQVVQAFLDGMFELVTSPQILAEIDEVLRRPRIRLRHGLPPNW